MKLLLIANQINLVKEICQFFKKDKRFRVKVFGNYNHGSADIFIRGLEDDSNIFLSVWNDTGVRLQLPFSEKKFGLLAANLLPEALVLLREVNNYDFSKLPEIADMFYVLGTQVNKEKLEGRLK